MLLSSKKVKLRIHAILILKLNFPIDYVLNSIIHKIARTLNKCIVKANDHFLVRIIGW